MRKVVNYNEKVSEETLIVKMKLFGIMDYIKELRKDYPNSTVEIYNAMKEVFFLIQTIGNKNE